MEIDKAIEVLKNDKEAYECYLENPPHLFYKNNAELYACRENWQRRKQACELAIAALEGSWSTRHEPEPRALTLEELRQRVGKPVWIETMNEWRIVVMAHDKENINLYNVYNTVSAKHVLNNDGRIYDREPKGVIEDERMD